jgi:hypothetical protein
MRQAGRVMREPKACHARLWQTIDFGLVRDRSALLATVLARHDSPAPGPAALRCYVLHLAPAARALRFGVDDCSILPKLLVLVTSDEARRMAGERQTHNLCVWLLRDRLSP